MIDAYLEGTMLESLRQRAEKQIRTLLGSLRAEEAAVLTLLQQRLVREKERDKQTLESQLRKSVRNISAQCRRTSQPVRRAA